MSEPTTNNQVAGIINGILKNIIEGAGEASVEAAVIMQVPWLGWPVIKQLFDGVLGVVAEEIYKQAAITATKIVIDVQVGLEESKTGDAFQNLQMAIASGDKVAIDKASTDLDTAYGDLIHDDGWSAP